MIDRGNVRGVVVAVALLWGAGAARGQVNVPPSGPVGIVPGAAVGGGAVVPRGSAIGWQWGADGQPRPFHVIGGRQRSARGVDSVRARAARASASPSYLMSPGGVSAGHFFGRTVPERGTQGQAVPSRYNRLGNYFGGRVR